MSLFTITLRPEPGDQIEPHQRLKLALKRLLRDHKLRAIDVREVPFDQEFLGDPARGAGALPASPPVLIQKEGQNHE